MIHYILCGFNAVISFENKDYKELEKALNTDESDLISYNPQSNNFNLLISRLDGYGDLLYITKEDLEEIQKNTSSLDFQEFEHVSMPIYWSTSDFEEKAKSNFNELKEDNPEEFAHLDNWEQLYDKSKFPEQLEKMINSHDASIGITWETLEEYVGQCEIYN